MKIIIIGAGVSGLSTYLLLRKVLPSFDSHTILVYEAHSPREALPTGASNPFPSMLGNLSDSAAVVGNIISLAPNSVRLLKFIDPKLYEIFKARGYINEHYTFKTARGHTLAVTPTRDNRYPVEYTISCPRYGLWKWLHEVVGEDKIQYRRVVEVDLSGEKPVVKFAGGGEEDADLVVGADGARSVVKKALFGEEAEGKYAARYEGFAGVGSFLDVEIPESVTKHKSMVFTFGPAGSFGQGAGQALEDSVTFCLLLSHYITKAETAGSDLTVKEGIELTAKGLYEIRSPRVAFVRDRSRRMYFTKKRINNVVVEYMWYVFIYLCTKFSMIGHLVIGIVFKSDEWNPEEQVKKYLKRMGH